MDAPLKVFLVMGMLDSIAGIMQTLASINLPGNILVLLSQAAIPTSMIISKLLLKVRYNLQQYLGAMIVASGIIIVLIPALSSKNSNTASTGTLIEGSILMLLSCVPMCLSSVYKEIALVEKDLDPIYLNGMVAIFQFLAAIPLTLPASLTQDPKVPISDIPSNLWDGLLCFFGVNSVTTGPYMDDCALAPRYVSLYIVFNILYNVLIILLVKYGSSNLLWLGLTLRVPVANITFSLPFVPNRETMHSTDLYGLIVIMLGLVLFRFGHVLTKRVKKR